MGRDLRLDRRNFLASVAAVAALPAMSCAGDGPAPVKPFFSPGARKIGLQLYMLGDELAKDMPGTFAALAEIGITDLELPNMLGKTAVELRQAADAAGLEFSSLHLIGPPLAPSGSLNFNSPDQEIVDNLSVLGVKAIVLPIALLPDDFRRDPGSGFGVAASRAFMRGGVDIWKRNADELSKKADTLAPHGIRVGYHNHNVEFAPVGSTTGWEILQAETDPDKVFFELDLGWVSAAGLDPAAEITKLGNRVRWLHVKDVKGTTKPNFALDMVPSVVGEGRLDWVNILKAAEAAGVEHYYIEQEPPFAIERLEAARRGHAFLAQHML